MRPMSVRFWNHKTKTMYRNSEDFMVNGKGQIYHCEPDGNGNPKWNYIDRKDLEPQYCVYSKIKTKRNQSFIFLSSCCISRARSSIKL